MRNNQSKIRFDILKNFLDNCEKINLNRADLLNVGGLDESYMLDSPYFASLESFKNIVIYSSYKIQNSLSLLQYLVNENNPSISPLGLLMLFSENFNEAILSFYNYRKICGDLEDDFVFNVTENQVFLCWSSENDSIFSRISVEYQCAWWLNFIRSINDELGIYIEGVYFSHEISDSNLKDYYKSFLGCDVFFNAQYTMLKLSKKILDKQIKSANREMYLAIEKHILDIFLQYKSSEKISDRVRSIIYLQLKEGIVTRERVAESLGVSTRTLTRKLNVDGISYSSILDEVRLEIAKDYLLKTQYKVIYISKTLGFFTSNAFITWFKDITGMSPGLYRSIACTKNNNEIYL